MGHDIFKFGTLCLNGEAKYIPRRPTSDGDIPQYDKMSRISIQSVEEGENISWIKPHGANLLIADRTLLGNVSWKDLDESGFVTGRTILLGGRFFYCRLLWIGEYKDVPNEWDKALDEAGEDNGLWHWKDIYFWGADRSASRITSRAVRGWVSARHWSGDKATYRSANVGFRPVLEPLSSDVPIPNVRLEGADFQLSSLPGGEGFCPTLQPMQGNVFGDIPVGSKVRMYTFTENGRPIHMDEPAKAPSKLTLTDRYFGDEYLVPWVVSNGIAVASRMLSQQKSGG